jgi:hypothetical protein
MILYVNGDSNSAGTEVDIKQSWPRLLQQKLDCDLINHARPGDSNPGILRITKNFLDRTETEKILVIIGWTSWEREEWESDGSYYSVNASGKDSVPPELVDRYKNWVLEQNDLARFKKSKILHQKIFELHQTLLDKRIPHLFFNALMPFQHETLTDNSSRFHWGTNYIEPYNNDYAYYWFLKRQGYELTASNHHQEPAQQFWADFLYQHIQQHQII